PRSTIRTCRPCSSSGRRGRSPSAPESGGRRPAPPCHPTRRSCNPRTPRCSRRRARSGTSRSSARSCGLLNDPLQLGGHFRNRRAGALHLSVASLPDDEIERAELLALLRIIVAEMAAAALAALDGRSDDRFRHGQEVVKIERCVPPGVVLAVPPDADAVCAL